MKKKPTECCAYGALSKIAEHLNLSEQQFSKTQPGVPVGFSFVVLEL